MSVERGRKQRKTHPKSDKQEVYCSASCGCLRALRNVIINQVADFFTSLSSLSIE